MGRFNSRKFMLCLLVVVAAAVLRYFDKIESSHLTAAYLFMCTAYIGGTFAQSKLNKQASDQSLLDKISTLPFAMSVVMVSASIFLQAFLKIDGAQFVGIITAVVGAYVTSNVLAKDTAPVPAEPTSP